VVGSTGLAIGLGIVFAAAAARLGRVEQFIVEKVTSLPYTVAFAFMANA
jgi:hypothetical protein